MAPGTWADVRVGDVVRVTDREAFPADLLLLRASDPPGQCWSNTKPLDGESDLKLRVAPKLTAALLEGASRPEELRQWLRGTVKCEAPNDKVSHRPRLRRRTPAYQQTPPCRSRHRISHRISRRRDPPPHRRRRRRRRRRR